MEAVKLVFLFIAFMIFGNVTSSGSMKLLSTPALESYNIDRNAISVSGLSSGAFMAVQLHVARSDVFMGVGVVAGGPFYCAQGSLSIALSACMSSPYMINVDKLITNAITQDQTGKIDSLSNLADSRVYIFSGTKDTTVRQGVAIEAENFYDQFANPDNIFTEYSYKAVHGFPTMNYGEPCDVMNEENFINKCDYDGAYHILNHIYGGNLKVPDYSSNSDPAGSVYMFDQSEFVEEKNPTSVGMYPNGYLFVPNSCKDGSKVCKLHVALHGCKQTPDFIGDTYVEKTGYNEVAALNDIIILYPQASAIPLTNANGCWDWWGYTGKEYAYNDGTQVESIMKMIERLAEGSSGSPSTTSTASQSTLTSIPVSTTVQNTLSTDTPEMGVVGSYLINTSAISTSGVSSGGFMAIQLHVAESETFMGVGAIAGGPYYCAEGNVIVATSSCMYMPWLINVDSLMNAADDYQQGGSVSYLDYLNDDKIYLFSGLYDTVVVQGVVQKAEDFYRAYVKPENIESEYSIPAQNGFPTMNQGGACDSLNENGLNNCDYDAAYEILNHIYGGNLQRPNYDNQDLAGNLLSFKQSDLAGISDPAKLGLGEDGLVFIPTACSTGSTECRLHVAFHGCKSGDDSVAEAFASSAGYNEVGALNDIIILYPRSTWTLVNPQDCWDWWGYTNRYYATNGGEQIAAIMNMIEYLES